MKNDTTEIKKLIFFSDEEYIAHFGEHYEATILHANRQCLPVVSIISANGTPSAIPLDRANNLLEKYYRLKSKEVYHAGLGELAAARNEATVASETNKPPKEPTLISGAA